MFKKDYLTEEENLALLRLFKKIYIKDADSNNIEYILAASDIKEKLYYDMDKIQGIFFEVEVANKKVPVKLNSQEHLKLATDTYGVNEADFSRFLFGNKQTIKNISDDEFYSAQLFHYFSNYYLGINFIPKDSEGAVSPVGLVNKPIHIQILRKQKEVVEVITNFLQTRTTVSEREMVDITTLFNALSGDIQTKIYEEVVSKDLLIKIFAENSSIATILSVEDSLRLILYIVNHTPLLIKKKGLHFKMQAFRFSELTEEDFVKIYSIVNSWNIEEAAKIFLRHKNIFLAIKKVDIGRHFRVMSSNVFDNLSQKTLDTYKASIRHKINKIRKAAKIHHTPFVEKINVNNLISSNLTMEELEIFFANIDEKTKSTDLIKLSQTAERNILLMTEFGNKALLANKVRNGSAFVKERNLLSDNVLRQEYLDKLSYMVEQTLSILTDRLQTKYPKTMFFIPENVHYALPTSGKQMIDVFPAGSYIQLPDSINNLKNNFTAGIHWENEIVNGKEKSVDLDLHASTKDGRIGWNSARSKNNNIYFSGDLVNAPLSQGGASEAIFIEETEVDNIISFRVHNFTTSKDFSFKFFLQSSEGNKEKYGRHGEKQNIFEPENQLVRPISIKLSDYATDVTLGYLHKDRFVFDNSITMNHSGSEKDMMKMIGIKNTTFYKSTLNRLLSKNKSLITSEEMLESAKAKIEHIDVFNDIEIIELRPENITPTTILSLFD